MKNWMRIKEKQFWSHSSSYFTTLMTWRFCEETIDKKIILPIVNVE